MKRRPTLPALILAGLIGAFMMTGAGAAEPGEYRLPVFETSDVHGYIADTSPDSCEYRLAYIADKVADVRDGMDDRAVLLDAGDIYQGNTLSNLLEGNPLSAAYALMGYDAVTLGNHEFDWGIENVVDADATMMDYSLAGEPAVNSVPVVLSNLYLNGEKASFTKDYVILEKTAADPDGMTVSVKIGVIGFAEDYSTSIMNSKFIGLGYTLPQEYDALEALAAELESSGQCDATILLTHSDAAEISALIPAGTAFDLILGGHTHENKCGVSENWIPYMEPACYGSAYAYTELVFRTDADGRPLFDRAELPETVDITADPALLARNDNNAEELEESVSAVTDEAIELLGDILSEKVGAITVSALKQDRDPNARVITRESTCGNWMASIYARAVGAEIGFVNGGGIREEFIIPEGKSSYDITVASVYAMFPFNNRIQCYEITYEEFMTLLRYSLTYAGGGLFSIMTGIDVIFTEYTVDEIVKDGETIYADGEWKIDPERKVTIAVNDYAATTARVSDKDSGSLENPLCVWKDTDRLIADDQTDAEAALRVLREEAAENGGLLTIDEKVHFIERKAETAAEDNADDSGSPDDAGTESGAGFMTYVVKIGDFLWKLASRFYGSGTLFGRIAEANRIADPDLIYAGQTLIIPAG